MTYYDELSVPEACAVLGVSSAAFKGRLFRAKRRVLNRTKHALVAPVHTRTRSASEYLKCK
jgi:DNA-directed RNA polymerase specialized sigma24 family protein